MNAGKKMRDGALLVAGLLLLAGFAARIAGEAAGSAHVIGTVTRVLGCVVLLYWAGWVRRSLTPLILAGMIGGIEVGLDAPGAAIAVHFVSDIFLRLVKTIVAPLILVTLISGIAGHGDLKSVGRMGWKSLVYFEVLTTVALVLGLIAANLSHVGRGLKMPADLGGALTAVPPPLHWQDFLVAYVFPENLAKSIADGQVLQVAVFAVHLRHRRWR